MIEETQNFEPPELKSAASARPADFCVTGLKGNDGSSSMHFSFCKSPIGTLEDIQEVQEFVNRLMTQCEYMEGQIEMLSTQLHDQQFFVEDLQNKNIALQNERLNLKDELSVQKTKNADYLELIEDYEARIQAFSQNDKIEAAVQSECTYRTIEKETSAAVGTEDSQVKAEEFQVQLKKQEDRFNEQLKDFSLKLTELLQENKQLHQLLSHRDFGRLEDAQSQAPSESPRCSNLSSKCPSSNSTPKFAPPSPAFSAAAIAHGDFGRCAQILLDRLASADPRLLHRRLGKAFDSEYICRFANTVVKSVESELKTIRNITSQKCSKSASAREESLLGESDDRLQNLLLRSIQEICSLKLALIELGPQYITHAEKKKTPAPSNSNGHRVSLIEYLFGTTTK